MLIRAIIFYFYLEIIGDYFTCRSANVESEAFGNAGCRAFRPLGAAKKSPKISKITASEDRLIKLPDTGSGEAKSVG